MPKQPQPPIPTARELFEDAGKALTPGPNWPSALADMLGVRRDSVAGWRTGKMELRSDHIQRLLALLERREVEVHQARERLQAWLMARQGDERDEYLQHYCEQLERDGEPPHQDRKSPTASRGCGTNPPGSQEDVMMEQQKECPECGHKFRGNGWDGIDAHWRSQHEGIMPYEEAWPLIKGGTYKPRE